VTASMGPPTTKYLPAFPPPWPPWSSPRSSSSLPRPPWSSLTELLAGLLTELTDGLLEGLPDAETDFNSWSVVDARCLRLDCGIGRPNDAENALVVRPLTRCAVKAPAA
jgi:hypothetical protein